MFFSHCLENDNKQTVINCFEKAMENKNMKKEELIFECFNLSKNT